MIKFETVVTFFPHPGTPTPCFPSSHVISIFESCGARMSDNEQSQQ